MSKKREHFEGFRPVRKRDGSLWGGRVTHCKEGSPATFKGEFPFGKYSHLPPGIHVVLEGALYISHPVGGKKDD